MDTLTDNEKIIDYYKSFGFEFIENYKTTNVPELPIQNRNLNVALLEMVLSWTIVRMFYEHPENTENINEKAHQQ